MFEMVELYDALVQQLGGQWFHRFPPGAHYGLIMMSEHLSETEIKAMTDFCGGDAALDYIEWNKRMGKEVNDEYPKEAFAYEEVAAQWTKCWSHSKTRPPMRVLLLGTSTMLDHKVTANDFNALMLEKFGFEESAADASEILVEFFEDGYDDMPRTVVNLLDALKDLKQQLRGRSASTLVCFTGRSYSDYHSYFPKPADTLRFWMEMEKWQKNGGSDEGCFDGLRPMFRVTAASETVVTQCRAYLRENRQ